ncbi:MAG: hypothetical protein K0S41_3740 [Anaerocolumna sp.]|nr:hypothetical protein [Anaerocolumna sp.]
MNDINNNSEKQSITSKFKASFASRKFKGGAYATIISVVVIVLIILVNVFVTELNLKIDVSNQNMYTLTGESKDYVKGIKDDITIYYIAQSGKEDASIKEMIEKYASYSSHIKIEYKDPVLYPKFASEYTDAELTENSVLVVNNTNGRAKYVDNADMFISDVDYQTYQTYVSAIDVEGQVTSALQYVTTQNLPIMYMVEGHGETAISDTLASSIAKVNVKTNTLSTLTAESIPEDCSILLMNGPQTDYSEDEDKMIKDYIAKGGDAIVLLDYSVKGLKNLKGLMEYYGINFVDGIVLESKQGYYMGQYVNNLVPNIESHDITTDIKTDKESIVVPTAVGIVKSDSARSSITIDPILTTSDGSYSKVDINSSVVDKEDGDIDGPFNLGVAITENYNNVETKLVVYGSSYIIDESMVSYAALGNLDLFLNSVNFVSGKEDSLAIRTRSVTQEYLTLNAAQVNFWAVIIVVIIPVLVLSLGGFVCLRRRKK